MVEDAYREIDLEMGYDTYRLIGLGMVCNTCRTLKLEMGQDIHWVKCLEMGQDTYQVIELEMGQALYRVLGNTVKCWKSNLNPLSSSLSSFLNSLGPEASKRSQTRFARGVRSAEQGEFSYRVRSVIAGPSESRAPHNQQKQREESRSVRMCACLYLFCIISKHVPRGGGTSFTFTPFPLYFRRR